MAEGNRANFTQSLPALVEFQGLERGLDGIATALQGWKEEEVWTMI
jgi:hypothetical protein